ncbi:pyr operon leader peptide, partial [Pseudomonas aeruginosa]
DKILHQMLAPLLTMSIMPDNLPGGCMVQCVRHFVLPRLKKDAGLPFFFPLITHSQPLNRGAFFCPGVRR